jgi:hypothetical protein
VHYVRNPGWTGPRKAQLPSPGTVAASGQVHKQADIWSGEHWDQTAWTICCHVNCNRRAVVGHNDVREPLFCCRGCHEYHTGRYTESTWPNYHNKECTSNIKYNEWALSSEGRNQANKEEKEKWEEKRRNLGAAPGPSQSETAVPPPPPPAPITQPKVVGWGHDFPVKARPAHVPATVKAPPTPAPTPAPEPYLIMAPRRSKESSIDPYVRRVTLFRSRGIATFKLRSAHKVAQTVWNWAENPTTTAISALVENLQFPQDSKSLRAMANTAEVNIQCAVHVRAAGQPPDELATPCEMCNTQARVAIESQVVAVLRETQEGGRRNRCPQRCMCNQSSGSYFVGAGTSSAHQLAFLTHEIHKHDGCCTSTSKTHVNHDRFGLCNLSTGHVGECICYTCESDVVALSRDRREQAMPVDKELTCGRECDCVDISHPGCCKVPDFNYNKACCLMQGHDPVSVTGVPSEHHLCEPCRTNYIEKHYELLCAAGAFPCVHQSSQLPLYPRQFVAKYPVSFGRRGVVEGDAGYVALDPDPWVELT